MSNKGGRPKKNDWNDTGFEPVHDAKGKVTGARCLVCLKVLTNTASSRRSNHRIGCRKGNDALNSCNNSTEIENETSVTSRPSSSFTQQLSKKRKHSSGFVKPFAVDTMSGAEKHSVDLLVTQFMFGCNIPLHIVDSAHFKGMIQALRSSYQPPKQREIKGQLLDELYEEILALKVSSNEDYGTLLVNGSQDTEVTVFVKPRNQSERFVKTYSMNDNFIDSLTSTIQSALVKTFALYNIKCDSLCIDNYTIVKDLQKEFLDLTVYSCKFKMLEDVETIIMDKSIAQQMYDLIFKIFEIPDVVIPAGSRFPISNLKAIEFFVENHQLLKQIVATHDVDAGIIGKVHDKSLMEKVKAELAKSKFINKLIKLLREKSLAEFIHFWKTQQDFVISNEMKELENEFINLPDLMSYTFDSKTKGSSLDKEQKAVVAEKVLGILSSKKAIEEYRKFIEFKESKGSFSMNNEFTTIETDLFWAHASNICQQLAAIGSKYSSLPPATISIRDSNEKFSFLHNPEQNNLSETELEKALHVYNTLQFDF